MGDSVVSAAVVVSFRAHAAAGVAATLAAISEPLAPERCPVCDGPGGRDCADCGAVTRAVDALRELGAMLGSVEYLARQVVENDRFAVRAALERWEERLEGMRAVLRVLEKKGVVAITETEPTYQAINTAQNLVLDALALMRRRAA